MDRYKIRFVVPVLKKTPDVRQMLQIEKADFTGFYECKNSQKEHFIYDFSSGFADLLSRGGEDLAQALLKFAVTAGLFELPYSSRNK